MRSRSLSSQDTPNTNNAKKNDSRYVTMVGTPSIDTIRCGAARGQLEGNLSSREIFIRMVVLAKTPHEIGLQEVPSACCS